MKPGEVLETYFRLFEAGKLDEMLSLFSAKGTFEINGMRRSSGRDEIKASLTRGLQKATGVQITINNLVETGDVALAEAVLRGIMADSEEPVELWFAAVAELENGQLMRLAEYFNMD